MRFSLLLKMTDVVSPNYQAIIDMDEEAIKKEEAKENSAFSNEKYSALKAYVNYGVIFTRSFGLGISVALILSCIYNIFNNLINFNIPLVALYSIVIRISYICLVLEYKESIFPSSYLDYLQREIQILKRPYGRSFVYCILGVIFLNIGSTIEFIIGVTILSIELPILYNLQNAENTLINMKTQMADDKNFKKILESCDYSDSGVLYTKDLYLVCQKLGTKLNCDEFETTLSILDSSGENKISYDKFKAWYVSRL